MPAAVVKSSSSRSLRVLAALLTSNLFLLASCVGTMQLTASVMVYGTNETKMDEAANSRRLPVPYGVAVVATIDPSSPEKKPTVAAFLREPDRDLARFRAENPSFSFLPVSDTGVVVFEKGGEFPFINVHYQVSMRESGKALVKTHYATTFPLIGFQSVSATYEATDSDIRLISYKSGPEWLLAFIGALLFTLVLSIVGPILKSRVVASPSEELGVTWKSHDNANGQSDVSSSALEVTIRYPRFLGVVGLILTVTIDAFLGLLVAVVLVGVVRAIWVAPAQKIVFLLLLLIMPVLLLVLLLVLCRHLWFNIRTRESIFTTFRVSQAELVIENSRYGVLTLNWRELTRATYTRMGIAGKTITLEAPQLIKPLAIMGHLRTPGSTTRFVIAQMLIQRAMGDRWVERWFGP